jgi:hypothetical protein
VAGDGRFAAIVERDRAVVVALPAASIVAEHAIDEDAQVAWLGTPSRLLVVTRGPGYQTGRLIEPDAPAGAATASTIRIEATMRIAATTLDHALLVGAHDVTLLRALGASLAPAYFPTRLLPTVAGPARSRFAVAINDAIEEWEPQQRHAIRRFRLRIPTHNRITALGGSDREFWFVTQATPARIDVIVLMNRGQPSVHELPEPIAAIESHPKRDLLACIGRESGRLYVVSLDGQLASGPVAVRDMDRIDSVAFCPSHTVAMVVARAGKPVKMIDLDGYPLAGQPSGSIHAAVHSNADAASASMAPATPVVPRGASPAWAAAPPTASASLIDTATPVAPIDAATHDAPIETTTPTAPVDVATPAAPTATTTPAAPVDAATPAAPTATTTPAASAVSELPAPDPASWPLRSGASELSPTTRTLDDSAYPPVAPPRPRPAPRASLQLPALGARSAAPRCSQSEYQAVLDHYRRAVVARTVCAIARDWDSGRLAFPSTNQPPHEAEVLGIAGRTSGLNTSRLSTAMETLEQATEELRIARTSLGGRLSPLDLLCREYGIDPIGEQVLLHVAAPALWGEIARLYGILANDASRATCDEHLLWRLLGDTRSRRELARALDPDAPLVRHGLVRVGERARPFQSLAADPIVVKLIGGYEVDHDEPGIDRIRSDVPLERVIAPREIIDHALAQLAAAPAGLGRLVVRGRTGSGRRTLLAALARIAGRSLAMIDVAPLVRDKRLGTLSALLQHANLRGWLPCVDGLDAISSDDMASRSAIRELIRHHHGPVAMRLLHHAQPPLDPDHVLIDLPTLSVAERAEQWRAALGDHALMVRDLDALAARFVVGTGTIRRVTALAARGAGRDTDRAVDDAMRQHLESKLGNIATRVTRLANWSQVVLPSDIQDSIIELVARIRHRRTVLDTWGFDGLMTSARGVTALFQGSPGTGKTMVAGAIAKELGLDLYRIDLSRVVSKWIGETEQNLGKVFDAAEEGQAVILFDEADSLFAKRTEVRTSVDRYANLEVNYLLQRLDSFEGVAILTTNFGTSIDPAFKRRMSVRVTFPFPDEEAREQLWRVHLPEKLPTRGKLDLEGLARRYKMSGGYIRNAALRAAFLAAEEGSPLTHEHLERAVRAEFREGGKLADSGVLE